MWTIAATNKILKKKLRVNKKRTINLIIMTKHKIIQPLNERSVAKIPEK